MFYLGFLVAICLTYYLGIGFFFYVMAEAKPIWLLFWPLMLIAEFIKRLSNR